MISRLNLPSSSIEESLFLSLCELSMCIHYRWVHVVFLSLTWIKWTLCPLWAACYRISLVIPVVQTCEISFQIIRFWTRGCALGGISVMKPLSWFSDCIIVSNMRIWVNLSYRIIKPLKPDLVIDLVHVRIFRKEILVSPALEYA